MLSVTGIHVSIPAVVSAANVRGDPEVLAKGRHREKERTCPSKEGRNGSIESAPFREREQNTTEENWVVLAGEGGSRSKTSCCRRSSPVKPTSVGASMTRPVPPENFPAPTKPSCNAPLPAIGTLGCLVHRFDQPTPTQGTRISPSDQSPQAPRPIHPGPAAAALGASSQWTGARSKLQAASATARFLTLSGADQRLTILCIPLHPCTVSFGPTRA